MADTCKTCKHWKPPGKEINHIGMYLSWDGSCGYGLDDIWHNKTDDKAWGMSHGMGADEKTHHNCGPDYGCIHHEPAEDDDE